MRRERARRLDPRPVSQPWLLEAVGTGALDAARRSRALLEEAGPRRRRGRGALHRRRPRASRAASTSSYERSLSLEDALESEAILAYEMNGAPLPPQHGFPAPALVPGWYGMTSVKWLTRIDVLDRAVRGLPAGARVPATPAARTRRARRVTRMLPRSLMVPPGIPEFFTRDADRRGRPVSLRGPSLVGARRASSRVEVSVDGGASWAGRRSAIRSAAWAWRGLDLPWEPEPGAYELCCRARDAAGTSSRSSLRGTWAATPTTPSSACRSPSFEQVAGEAPAADQALGSAAGQLPELAVGCDEPVGREAWRFADQPLVRRLARRLEDDAHVDVLLLRPLFGEGDQLVRLDVRPDGAADVLRVDQDRWSSVRLP